MPNGRRPQFQKTRMARALPTAKVLPPLLLLVILQISTLPSSVYGIRPSSVRDLLRIRDEIPAQVTQMEEEENDVEELYLKQRLDHFRTASSSSSSLVPHTFSQRYFYTNRYVAQNGKDEPRERSNSNLRANSKTERKTYAFLCVGGEGPSLDKSVLIDSVHCTGDMIRLAEKLFVQRGIDVHLFALEHRYYGNSYPDFSSTSLDFDFEDKDQYEHENEDENQNEISEIQGHDNHNNKKRKKNNTNNISPVTNQHLKYLSSRQALSDISHFIQHINSHPTFNFQTKSVPWITFGGSYPGMLAAWARLKFPHQVLAAVSNSAPVQATLDFEGYKDKVGDDLRNTDIGGSDLCREIVVQGHDEIALAVETEVGRETVAELFDVCGGAESLEVKENVDAFLGDGVIWVPAQENDPSCEGELCNIDKICNQLTTTSNTSKMAALASVAQKQRSSCTDISWSDSIDFLSNPEQSQRGGTRSWYYQTCAEFGFFQTCNEQSSCPFGRGYHTVDVDLQICEEAFGISSDMVRSNIDDTLEYYGGWDMAGSRILSVNGDVDPWSVLSMSEKMDPLSIFPSSSSLSSETKGAKEELLPTNWSKSASHHFWTHAVKETDDPRIVATRNAIHTWVMQVLDEFSDGVAIDSDSSTRVTHISSVGSAVQLVQDEAESVHPIASIM